MSAAQQHIHRMQGCARGSGGTFRFTHSRFDNAIADAQARFANERSYTFTSCSGASVPSSTFKLNPGSKTEGTVLLSVKGTTTPVPWTRHLEDDQRTAIVVGFFGLVVHV